MTEHDFDPMLRAALLESAAKRWTLALEDGPELVWTPERERRMARLLADPFHRAKRHSRPRWQRFLAAACLALLCSLTLWGLYTSSPTVRARAIWSADVTEVWYDDHVEFTFFHKGNPELRICGPAGCRRDMSRPRPMTWGTDGTSPIKMQPVSGWSLTMKCCTAVWS